MKKMLLSLAIMLLGISAFAQTATALLSKYYAVKNELIKGNHKAAAQAAIAFQQAVKGAADFKEKSKLAAATDKLVKAPGLDQQRTAFSNVSVTMWKLIKTADKIDQPVYYQYCPMKKAYWLSHEAAIKNPYYGSSMLTCGNVAESRK